MSKKFSFPLHITNLPLESGHYLTIPGNSLDLVLMGSSPFSAAKKFERRAQKKLLLKGQYLEAFRHFPQGDWEIREVAVRVEGADDGTYESHEIKCHVITWVLANNQQMAVVPALGVGHLLANPDNFQEEVSAVIQLEFKRQDRQFSASRLVSVQWYQAPKVAVEDVELEFYTAAELAVLNQEQEEPIIAKTARRMPWSKLSCFNMENYVDILSKNLTGEFRQSTLLVGPSGCGKTSLVNEFVKRNCKEHWNRPWETTAAQMLQALTEESGWQSALGRWVKEARTTQAVIYIKNFAELFQVGQYSGNAISIAEALKEPLSRNELIIISEVTAEQLAAIELKVPGYSQLFHVVKFNERSDTQENEIALKAVNEIAQVHGKRVDESALGRIIQLQRRYAPYSGFPGKIIRFFENLILNAEQDEPRITEEIAIDSFCEESGIPVELIDYKIPFEQEKAREFFRSRLIGQETAQNIILRTLVTLKAGLAVRGRPIASFLMVGPTGVGKTEMAKTLAHYIFGDEDRMLRFDMSEYSDPYSVSRFTAPNEASLVTKVRQQPFSVVLFDEVEKADASFFDLLLQILGEGRLSDDQGDLANFCSAIVIMTSNIGAQDMMASTMGFTDKSNLKTDVVSHFEQAVSDFLRPELFNRIDHLVPFLSLTSEEQLQVFYKELDRLKSTAGLQQRALNLTVEDSVMQSLNEKANDPQYGARNLQRILKQYLIKPLAAIASSHPFGDEINVSVTGNLEDKGPDWQVSHGTNTRKNKLSKLLLSEDTTIVRRKAQALLDCPSWIGCLSSLDRLEALKRKKKEKFWQDMDLVKRYETLSNLKKTVDTLFQDIMDQEYQEFSVLLNNKDDIFSDLHQRTEHLSQKLHDQLFAVESTLSPEANRVLLAVYANMKQLDHSLKRYQNWLELLDIEYNLVWIFHDEEPEKPEFDEEGNLKVYQFQESRKHQKAKLPIGFVLDCKGVCAHHYLSLEAGKSVVVRENARDEVMFTEVLMQRLPGYYPQTGVHRQGFYRELKTKRKYRGEEYLDERFGQRNQYIPISEHLQKMEQKALAILHLKFFGTELVTDD